MTCSVIPQVADSTHPDAVVTYSTRKISSLKNMLTHVSSDVLRLKADLRALSDCTEATGAQHADIQIY